MNNIFPDFHTSISIQTEIMRKNVNRLVFFSTPFSLLFEKDEYFVNV